METHPPADSSSERHSNRSVDLNKKRKLQDESGSLGMSSPKQRFKVGANICCQGLVIRGGFSEEPIVTETEILNAFDQPEESEKDSNTFIGAFDNSMSSDAKDSNDNSITLTIHQNQPSTSSNSYSDEDLKTHLYSLESRGAKELKNASSADLEDTLQFDPGYKAMEDIHSGFGFNHPISELASEADAGTEAMILYSNDVAPHSFVHSSGWWNLGEGAPLGRKRPTIDQEFEQYFSSLLL